MGEQAREVIEWVAGHVLPHDRELRERLRRTGAARQEIDDIVQETYLHIAELPSIAHIRDGRAYLLASARGALLKRVRHERVVRIDQLADGEALDIADEAPDAERRMMARQELARVAQLIRDLPPRCRQVFELRRIDGLSQRGVAERLGIPEHTVEQEAMKGLRLLISGMTSTGDDQGTRALGRRMKRLVRRGGRQP